MTDFNPKKAMTYQDAGVNIDAGNALVEFIKPLAARTKRSEVLGGIGGFSGLFQIPLDRYREPVLVASTDGVGTKLKLALDADNLSGIGIDLVAMCVNDILVSGAEPLFFLDYYACGQLNLAAAKAVLESIVKGCELSNMTLLGGETAEMPGLYQKDDFDLAGFVVGIIEKSQLTARALPQPGQVLIGMASSGAHANGYSLIRKIIDTHDTHLDLKIENQSLKDLLLAPTKIYVRSLLALRKQINIAAMAHITGGGLLENIPRVLPENTVAVIDTKKWPMPALFSWLQQQGNIENNELYRTFNCGIGMVLCLDKNDVAMCLQTLKAQGEMAWEIGYIDHHQGDSHVRIIT